MGQSITKDIRKGIRRKAKSVGRAAKKVRDGARQSTAKKVAVTGVAIAGAAGVAAAAAHYLRNGRGAATFHVLADGDGWALKSNPGGEPIGSYATKRKAVAAARKAASAAAPSELVIYRSDGSVDRSHSYLPAAPA
jgi:hypothetical protein